MSSQSNPNPLSTIGFLWNMGYPPPPITMDSLKKMTENCIDNQSFVLPEKLLSNIIHEVKAQPFMRVPVILFVIQQSLHSSKIEKVSNSMELTHAVFLEMGLEFARYFNREFMVSIKNVIGTSSYKDRTIGGSLKKLEKWVVGGTSSGIATDPKVQALQKRCLQMVRIWVDMTVNDHLECSAIHEMYKKMSSRGYRFPAADCQLPTLQSFTSSYNNAGGYGGQGMPSPPNNILYQQPQYPGTQQSSVPYYQQSQTREQVTKGAENVRPIDDTQLEKLDRALNMQKRNAPGKQEVQDRCLAVFKTMLPRMTARIDLLTRDDAAFNPIQEAQLARVLRIKDEMDAFIAAMEPQVPSVEDEFADLGLDEVIEPPRDCPFNEPVQSGSIDQHASAAMDTYGHQTTTRYSSFTSVASDDDLMDIPAAKGGSIAEGNQLPEPPIKKIVDPFAALNDVWEWEE
eukprot:GHVH01012286.1.p1 GENE.GHVH01012286.1~~GHVH01012286.1.p1  ORF type:complete len:456 (+),score=70.82 GHVH01012286.1:145-1512(+)